MIDECFCVTNVTIPVYTYSAKGLLPDQNVWTIILSMYVLIILTTYTHTRLCAYTMVSIHDNSRRLGIHMPVTGFHVDLPCEMTQFVQHL